LISNSLQTRVSVLVRSCRSHKIALAGQGMQLTICRLHDINVFGSSAPVGRLFVRKI